MNFFEAQRSAKQRTKLLVVLFTAAVVSIVAVNCLVFHVFLVFGTDLPISQQRVPNPKVLAWVTLGTLAVIVFGTVVRTAKLRRGGPAVTELAGGRRVDSDTADPGERRLLNVVEEMAIASGVPVPAVYVLPETGINAFAAGHTIHDAAVAFTRGAMQRLDRDELQGVAAHEFSHILNGDMRLNLRLIGLVHGILLIALIGREMLTSRGRSSRRRVRAKARGGAMLLAFALMVVGYIGVFFGRLIKAAISRQREFLADAAAVQFTRNPGGIAGALKKIGGHIGGSRVRHGRAEEISHMFFANGIGRSLFATHPPLPERIRRIDPSFDGEFPAVEPLRAVDSNDESAAAFAGAAGRAPAVGRPGGTETGESAVAPAGPARDRGGDSAPDREQVGIGAEELIASVGALTPEHVSRARRLLARLPEELDTAARSPGGAQALLLALLFDSEDAVARRQRTVIEEHGGRTLLDWVDALLPAVRAQPREARLALVDLALPSLERLPAKTAVEFRAAVHELVRADGAVRLFEHALIRLLRRHLHDDAEPVRGTRGHRPRSLADATEDLAVVLSAVARAGATTEDEVRTGFRSAAESLRPATGELRLPPAAETDIARIDVALDRLGGAPLDVRRRFLEACARCVAHDGRIRVGEIEMLRAIAAGLDCPMPPLLARVGASEGSVPEA